ncbi:hypothetical protein GY404_001897 [Campylobacter coli]|nr:hypothetical protein [Campylobacter coli]
MNNKILINKFKDNAELAQAAYGYFDLIGKKIENDEDEYGDKANKPITLHDILDSTYTNYETQDSTFTNTLKLKGDFSPTQTKRFFKKYDMLKHCPNTESNGFSATFFYNKESKEYILAIRGTEFKLDQIKDLINDYYIGTNNDRKTA